jgi:hypothetical protein
MAAELKRKKELEKIQESDVPPGDKRPDLRRLHPSVWSDIKQDLVLEHLPGKANTLADALSRGQMDLFRRLCPRADPRQMAIPDRAFQLM